MTIRGNANYNTIEDYNDATRLYWNAGPYKSHKYGRVLAPYANGGQTFLLAGQILKILFIAGRKFF